MKKYPSQYIKLCTFINKISCQIFNLAQFEENEKKKDKTHKKESFFLKNICIVTINTYESYISASLPLDTCSRF